jgi:predicted peptidase
MTFDISVEYLNTLDQEDPILSDYIRDHLWIPAVPKNVPYNLYKPTQVDFTEGQWPAILDVFNNHV